MNEYTFHFSSRHHSVAARMLIAVLAMVVKGLFLTDSIYPEIRKDSAHEKGGSRKVVIFDLDVAASSKMRWSLVRKKRPRSAEPDYYAVKHVHKPIG